MPEEVDAATFAAFREHLQLTLLKDPSFVFRYALIGWNAARAQVSGWPVLTVSIPAPRTTAWLLAWSAFPESLYGDVCYLVVMQFPELMQPEDLSLHIGCVHKAHAPVVRFGGAKGIRCVSLAR